MEKDELKKQIEALLFSSGRTLSNDDIAKLIKIKSKEAINENAIELKKEYENRNSPIMLIEEGDGWKMTIREKYLSLVRSINPHTEISKTIMETLAIIAWKSPVLQSEVINIRTNKAYDHITELEELGFLIKEKYKRTFILKLTQKFFDYFDLKDKKDITKIFKNIKDIENEEQLKVDKFNEDEYINDDLNKEIKDNEIKKTEEIIDNHSKQNINNENNKIDNNEDDEINIALNNEIKDDEIKKTEEIIDNHSKQNINNENNKIDNNEDDKINIALNNEIKNDEIKKTEEIKAITNEDLQNNKKKPTKNKSAIYNKKDDFLD
jgi:segregation and condensation protein B